MIEQEVEQEIELRYRLELYDILGKDVALAREIKVETLARAREVMDTPLKTWAVQARIYEDGKEIERYETKRLEEFRQVQGYIPVEDLEESEEEAKEKALKKAKELDKKLEEKKVRGITRLINLFRRKK